MSGAWLVLAAGEFEAASSLAVLRSLGVPHRFVELGVGPLIASRRAATLAEDLDLSTHVLYIGTCGVFAPFREVFLVSGYELSFSTVGHRLGLEWVPNGLYPSVSLSLPVSSPLDLGALPCKKVLTSSGVSLSSELGRPEPVSLVDPDQYVENMELYALAPELKRHPSCHIILGVTNQVGPEGSQQWRQNHAKADLLTAKYIRENLII